MSETNADCLSDALDVMSGATEVYSAAQIDEALDRLSTEITEQVADSDPTILAVMQGGAFTAIQLCRRFAFPHRFDFVHGTRYGNELEGGNLTWRVPPSAGCFPTGGSGWVSRRAGFREGGCCRASTACASSSAIAKR